MPLPKLPTSMGATVAIMNPEPPTATTTKATVSRTASKTAAPAKAARQADAPALKAPGIQPSAKTAAKEPEEVAPTVPAPVAQARTPAKKRRLAASKRKLFVLDTNVLLHDSNSLFKFEEHDIFLPMMVLEELDHQKKGMSEVARNARQVSRSLDGLVSGAQNLE